MFFSSRIMQSCFQFKRPAPSAPEDTFQLRCKCCIHGYASWVLGFVDHLLRPKSVRLIQWPRKTANSVDNLTVLTPREVCLPYTLRCNQRPKPFKFFGFHTRAMQINAKDTISSHATYATYARPKTRSSPFFVGCTECSSLSPQLFVLSTFHCYKDQAPDTPCSPRGTMKGPATRLWVDSARLVLRSTSKHIQINQKRRKAPLKSTPVWHINHVIIEYYLDKVAKVMLFRPAWSHGVVLLWWGCSWIPSCQIKTLQKLRRGALSFDNGTLTAIKVKPTRATKRYEKQSTHPSTSISPGNALQLLHDLASPICKLERMIENSCAYKETIHKYNLGSTHVSKVSVAKLLVKNAMNDILRRREHLTTHHTDSQYQVVLASYSGIRQIGKCNKAIVPISSNFYDGCLIRT